MKLYNTLTKQKMEFKPLKEGEISVYACGPTVYNYIHIGNARPICVFDVLRRYLEYSGYTVKFAQNFTDIDDKIIAKSNTEGIEYDKITEKYINEYQTDAKGLNVKPPTFTPRATENIDAIIQFVEDLIRKDYAYVSGNDVYFEPSKFADYGKLSGMPISDLEAGARIKISEQKRNPMDFVLWKSCKPGEPAWNSPWGPGRPGWHIECSVMAKTILGNTIDIHCGGQDLIFPHHENEMAQSECGNGTEFARFWLHNGYINVDNKKMSKSLGNFFTVREIAEKYGYEPIRFMMISAHYRTPINYSLEVIEQSAAALERLYECENNVSFRLKTAPETSAKDGGVTEKISKLRERFTQSLDDDLNTADAIAVLFDLTKLLNLSMSDENGCSCKILDFGRKLFDEICSVLGLLHNQKKKQKTENLDSEIEQLIEERQKARAEKNFALADKIRDDLLAIGIALKDTKQGVIWSRV